MLELKQVAHHYDRQLALSTVTFTLERGIVGILGRNGAGKSTLLRILATVLKPSAGVVLFNGTDAVKHPGPLRQATAYLPQDLGYPSSVTARTYVRYLLALRGADSGAAAHWLHKFGLGDVAAAKLGAYSGGMRQRVGLAYAFGCDARVLLLDEPSQGLDPWERVHLHQLLADLAAKRLILFSTHIVSDIAAIAQRIIILDRGEIRFDGSPTELMQNMDADPVWVLRSRQPRQPDGAHTVSAVRRLLDGAWETRGIGHPLPIGAVPVNATLEDRYLRMTDPLVHEHQQICVEA